MAFTETMYYVDTDQGRTPFPVSIRAPARHPAGDFTCVIQIGGESESVGGIDPIQCLTLATSRLRQRLASLSENEGLQLFLGPEDPEPLHLSSLFPLDIAAPWVSDSDTP